MSWFPWTESIKKRICRYLLQHYLGHFLKEKLQYEQLSVDLYNGAGSVKNVQLDVFAINEVVQKVNAPIEILHGSVQAITVRIPWKTIFSESCIIEVRGIHLTIQPKYVADTDLANMTDSFCNSFKHMTTSMQVAQECMLDPEKQETETPMGGLDMFAQAIDSIFRRIKLKFGEISLCFEHSLPLTNSGVGLQLSVKCFEYCDEDSDKANEEAAQHKNSHMIDNIAFSCKQFRISGVDISIYQLKENNIFLESNAWSCESVCVDPILISELYGDQQIKIRIKQNDQLSGPKIDAEFYLGNIAALISPKQLSQLVSFVDGFINPLNNNESNFTPDSFSSSVSPDGLSNYSKLVDKNENLKRKNNSFGCEYDCSEIASFQSPVSNPKIVQFQPTACTHDSFSYDGFKSTVEYLQTDDALTMPSKPPQKLSGNSGGDQNFSKVFHLQVKVVALSLAILHVDPTDIGKKGGISMQEHPESETKNSFDECNNHKDYLLNFVEKYFSNVKKAFETHRLIDLFNHRQLFTDGAEKHDHISVLAGPLHIECECKAPGQEKNVSFAKVNASIGNAQLFECLYNEENIFNRSSCSYVELLVFPSFLKNTVQSSHCIRLSVETSDTNELLHKSIHLQLFECKSEVDISIVDRVSEILNSFDVATKGPSSTVLSSNTFATTLYDNDAAMFQKVLDESGTKTNELDLTVTSSIHIAFRFPIPDLRPDIQKRPWFERLIRDEVLYLDVKDLECHANIVTRSEQNQLSDKKKSVKCVFKEMCASYAEKPQSEPTLFLRTSQYIFPKSEIENDYDCPVIQVDFHQVNSTNQILNSDDGKAHFESNIPYFIPHSTGIDEHDTIPLFSSQYESLASRKASPFSHRKVIHNDEHLMLPGDEEEIQDFVEHASGSARVSIMLNLPSVTIALPSKSFIENIYNRFGNDLLLWKPAAPQPNVPTNLDLHLIPARLDLESQFFSSREQICELGFDKSTMGGSLRSDEDDDETTTSVISNNTLLQKSYEVKQNQSYFSVSLNIKKGYLSLCSSIESENSDVRTGQIFIELSNGSLFTVTQYLGNPNLDYLCVQIESCSLYHEIGLLSIPVMEDICSELNNMPSFSNSVIYPVEKGVVSAFQNCDKAIYDKPKKMVTVVVKLELEKKRAIKRCLVAALLDGLALRHEFLPIDETFFVQLMNVFTFEDTPVLGYEPPTLLTEVHFHVRNCAIDYKPLHLSSRAIATVNSFSLSSNVTADSERSTLQIVMDNVNLFLSDSHAGKFVDLRQNFVNVFSVALLELCLKVRNRPLSTGNQKYFPDIELTVSNSHVQMWTCADSCALLAALLRYIADNGDMAYSVDEDNEKSSACKKEDINEKVGEEMLVDADEKNSHEKTTYEEHLEDLLADAVIELDHDIVEKSCTDVCGMASVYEENDATLDEFVFEDEDTFCVIDELNDHGSQTQPQINYFVEDKIVIVENYFTPVTGRGDQLKPPEHFPFPLLRYAVREISFSWYIFGGNDFCKKIGSKPDKELHENHSKLPKDFAKRSPLHVDKKMGGVNRNHKVRMEFHVTKARFHHEVYHPDSEYSSRTVLAVANFEVHDRLQSSQINKFLYHFHNESSPKQSNADMFLIKALLVKVEQQKDPECQLRVSLQPLRLNIDQDALIFLTEYFANLANSVSDDASSHSDDGSCSTYGTAPSTFAEPKLEVKHLGEDISFESNPINDEIYQSTVTKPLFFSEFIFSPTVPIRLDYHGKRIDIEHGRIAGLLMGLGRLNCSQLKLQKIVHQHGLLGVDKLVNFALNEWAADIRNNQLPSILGGVGPMHSFIQLFQGVRDLVWLPVEQYRKDGRIVRGLQRGTTSFGTSTSMAILELGNRLTWLIQSAAETTCDIVSPSELQKNRERYRNSWRGLEKQTRRSRQPNDVREGFNNAYSLLHHGFTDAVYSIARVAQREHERRGFTGAVGGVIRHMPVTLVRPFAIASEATSHVLSGIRNQIEPDARREDEDKWRNSANAP